MSTQHLVEDRAAAEELRAFLLAFRTFGAVEAIHAADDAFGHAFRHRRHHVVFVVDAEVIENFFVLDVHAAHTVVDDGRQLVAVGRIIRLEIRDARCEELAVSIFVLQAFAVERRPT